MGSIAHSAVSVVTDIISGHALVYALELTSQEELLCVLCVELYILIALSEIVLKHVFEHSEGHIDHLEHVVLRFVGVAKMGIAFVILRLFAEITRTLLLTCHITWHEALVALILVLSVLFIIIERGPTPS